MSNIRVPIPPGLSPEMHGTYAAEAIRQAEAREQMRRDAIEARREKQAAITEALAQIERENKARDEKKAEEEDQKAAHDFEADLKRGYFNANRGASEIDWLRDKKIIKGEAMRRRALDALANQESIKASLLKRGDYSKF